MARPVLVDTDPGLLRGGLDVDDDLALLFLLGSPEVEIVGVTTTFGNTLGSLAHRDAVQLLARAGRSEIPVARGADGPGDGETEASRLLVEAVRRRPGELTLLTLGPLTNLAMALRARPGLLQELDGLVVMGGRSVEGLAEFNFRRDPPSAAVVLGADGRRKTQIPFDLAFGVAVTAVDVERLPPGSVAGRHSRRLRWFANAQDRFRAWRGRAPGQAIGGFHPWDLVAAAHLVRPDLFGASRRFAISVDGRGRSSSREVRGGSHASAFDVPSTLAAAPFLDLVLERVGSVRDVSEVG